MWIEFVGLKEPWSRQSIYLELGLLNLLELECKNYNQNYNQKLFMGLWSQM